MENFATLSRFVKTPDYTIGKFYLEYNNNACKLNAFTLELPFLNNNHSISSIPVGLYKVELFNSPTHGVCFLVKNVPNRSMIEIHKGNYPKDTKGCILLGTGYFIPANYCDGMVTNSDKAMKALIATGVKEFNLLIKEIC